MNNAQLIRIQGESQVNALWYLHVFIWLLLIFKAILAPSSRPLLSTLKVVNCRIHLVSCLRLHHLFATLDHPSYSYSTTTAHHTMCQTTTR